MSITEGPAWMETPVTMKQFKQELILPTPLMNCRRIAFATAREESTTTQSTHVIQELMVRAQTRQGCEIAENQIPITTRMLPVIAK